ncbi:glycosyl transferase family 2 [Rhodovulum bhavnagarense]|uniref:Glycosyl transferase family 2 n=1 Tax=Rhodovulum bhavnagarense TaxID=992286 RepID=A0A4R2RCF1_9RHOB|nr:glycosyltransferase [Rhodovulum bhavnagarense]TCP59799.1 glycosyl transferase family 2 [Rhodovulum bhavnagarense]
MIDVAIFAYNRPDYLKNCVESVERHIPGARLRVHDDASTDPEMRAYLATLGERAVLRPASDAARHGGLYANMNAALDRAEHDIILMLQDDTQVVRDLTPDDLFRIEGLFQADTNRAFVSPLFMKADRMRRFRRELRPDPAARAYVSPPDHPRTQRHCLAYFDVHMARVDRLRAAGWRYDAAGEGTIGNHARELFGPMPMMADPFVFFCPEVPFFRNRDKKTLASRIAGRFVGRHVKAFEDMGQREIARLISRDLSVWPVAENFLTPKDPRVVRPFVYKDVKARGWLYALHKIEQALRG